MLFKEYGKYYDIYYSNKDYSGETDFVINLASQFGARPKTVLDMGCGTGRHLLEFAKRGLKGDGFDMSQEMIQQASYRLNSSNINVVEGNLCNFRNGKRYDLVVAMFAVMGYLTTNDELLAGLNTAYSHLDANGLFIFDGWFGPAVLAQKPEIRIHKYYNENQLVIRKATPFLDPVEQVVTVHYEITTRDEDGVEKTSVEDHRMRFLFIQEIKLAMQACRLEFLYACPFLKMSDTLSTDTWNIIFVARPKQNME